MPATQVEFDHRNESFQRIVVIGHWKERFRMCHEAVHSQYSPFLFLRSLEKVAYFVIRSSIDRGSRINVGRVTLLKSAPGRSWDMMCDKTFRAITVSWKKIFHLKVLAGLLLTIALIRLYNGLIFRARVLLIAGFAACYS